MASIDRTAIRVQNDARPGGRHTLYTNQGLHVKERYRLRSRSAFGYEDSVLVHEHFP
jgi:hypothetical protein